jgi:ketosteroid isomerase-like protein
VSENAEIIRAGFAAISSGDYEAALEWLSDDVVMDWTNSIGPAKGVYHGKDEIREVWDSFQDAFESVTWTPEEIIELDDDRLIVVNHVRMRGRGSGVEVDAVGAQLWTVENGKGKRLTLFQSKRDALQAARRR